MEETLNTKQGNTKQKDVNTKKDKLSYDQLNDACNQLWQQNKQLLKRNNELEEFCMYKRLDYLFKVVENSTSFSSDFVITCTDEIQEAMNISKEGK